MSPIWPLPKPDASASAVPQPLRPGLGTLVTANSLGRVLSAQPSGPTFLHPWRPALSGTSIALGQGTIYSLGGDGVYTPKVKVDGKAVAMTEGRLKLDSELANQAGESWIVLEIVPNAAGEIVKDSRVEIVHTSTPLSHARTLGRQPLALILWQNNRPQRAIAIAHWNFRYLRLLDDIGGRHLFL